MLEAYLDIETTGLSPAYDNITVIGIYLTDGDYQQFVQLVGEEVTRTNLLEVLQEQRQRAMRGEAMMCRQMCLAIRSHQQLEVTDLTSWLRRVDKER